MNVAFVWFTCIVLLATYSIGDAYQAGRRRDAYWAHQSYITRHTSRPSTNRPSRRYSDINSVDNDIWSDMKVKKHYHGNGNSYQYSSFFNRNRNRDPFGWDYPSTEFFKVKMPKLPPIPAMSKENDMNSREWPEWIPPIRMIKLPLDEPPARI